MSNPLTSLVQGYHIRSLHSNWVHWSLQFHLTLQFPLKTKIYAILSLHLAISILNWFATNAYGKGPDVCGLHFNFTITKAQGKYLNKRKTPFTYEFLFFIRNTFIKYEENTNLKFKSSPKLVHFKNCSQLHLCTQQKFPK